jgi:hypothetical protein
VARYRRRNRIGIEGQGGLRNGDTGRFVSWQLSCAETVGAADTGETSVIPFGDMRIAACSAITAHPIMPAPSMFLKWEPTGAS